MWRNPPSFTGRCSVGIYGSEVAFDDGVGEVSGTWVKGRTAYEGSRMLVYIMVEDMERTLALIAENGGTVAEGAGAHASEITAMLGIRAATCLECFRSVGERVIRGRTRFRPYGRSTVIRMRTQRLRAGLTFGAPPALEFRNTTPVGFVLCTTVEIKVQSCRVPSASARKMCALPVGMTVTWMTRPDATVEALRPQKARAQDAG